MILAAFSNRQGLLWCELLLCWSLINYALPLDPIGAEATLSELPIFTKLIRRSWLRATTMGLALLVLCLPASFQCGLTTFVAGATVQLAFLTGRWSLNRLASPQPSKADPASTKPKPGILAWVAEYEIGSNILICISSAFAISHLDLALPTPLVLLPLSDDAICKTALVVAALCFASHGGSHVVRGVLDKGGAYPKPKISGQDGLDLQEYNAGRIIGILERLATVAFVVAGQYEAIGFVLAAKGLIRSKEFEKKDFAEYFLLGTMASVGVSTGVGLVLKWLLPGA